MAPEEAIAALSTTATWRERLDALRVFLDRWFGPRSLPTVGPETGTVPAALGAFCALVDGRKLTKQNRLLEPARRRVTDGKLVFYVENQGVCEWATDLGAGDDPPVYVRMNEHGAPWKRDTDHVSTFVLGLTLLESVFGAPFDASADAIDVTALRELTTRVARLSVPSWQTSGTSFLGGAGVIGFVAPNGPDFDVWLGASTREPFEAIEDLLAEWPHQGF